MTELSAATPIAVPVERVWAALMDFDLEPTADGSLLRHTERFGGLLGPVVVRILGPRQADRYAWTNERLKRILESPAAV